MFYSIWFLVTEPVCITEESIGMKWIRKFIVWFELHKVTKNKYLLCFHSLIISIYINVSSGSTCKEAAILNHHVSTVAQNMVDPRGFVTLP